MEQFRIATDNAIEFYLRDPSTERARDLLRMCAQWPWGARASHTGLLTAVQDALVAKHGQEVNGAPKVIARIGHWLIRKGCPEWKPTWGDYWLMYWKLTRADRPGLARLAIKELHRRGWHLPITPEWGVAEMCALRLIVTECQINEDFRKAMRDEIARTPCGSHDL